MTADVPSDPRQQPFHWWGLPWTPPNPRAISELVDGGMLSLQMANWLRGHVRHGGSLVVVASAPSAGKSTLAHSLIEAIGPGRTLAYIRGSYESFNWTATSAANSMTLLVNEISPHLPTYCWGGCARTVLQLAATGSQLIATLHADSIDELRALLQGAPIHATDEQVVALNVVVFLDSAAPANGLRRRVTSIVRLNLDSTSGRIIATPVRI